MSILETLFDGKYISPQENIGLPPEMSRRRRELIHKLEAQMGAAFLEEYWDNYCEIERFQNLRHFQEGFRLGAMLMLEAGGSLKGPED